MIHWIKTTEELPEPETQLVLFKVRGEKCIRVGTYAEASTIPSGFEDLHAAEYHRCKRVSHWAPINLP